MILGQIIGDRAVIAHLEGSPAKVMGNVRSEVHRLVLMLLAKVKAEKLSGQVLRNQTGTLRRSINQRVGLTPTTATGSVGTNLSYAAAHEFGFKGPVNVAAHVRRNLAQMKSAWRLRALGRGESGPRQGYYSNKGKGQGAILVQAHTRQMNLPERSFLRSALKEMAPEIHARLEAAVRSAL